jgi:hypothetical protein
MIRTFPDSNVLIDAARGNSPQSDRARSYLAEVNREFISSIFIRLEVLPKAAYHHRDAEVKYYETFFDSVISWLQPTEYALHSALTLAKEYGLGPLDALHLTTARILNADEFITGEKPSSPLFGVEGIKIIPLFA